MRLLARIRARANCVYDESYHANLRGRIWRALRGTDYEQYHDEPVSLGMCFSNPFPWGDLSEGDVRHLLISAVDEELLAHIADDLLNTPTLDIGEMPFTVEDVSVVSEDVGEPGTSGVLETSTGVCVQFSPRECEEYGIDSRFDEADTFWRPEYSLGPFVDTITQNLAWKHEQFGAEYVPGPEEADYDRLFDGYERIKSFAVPVRVSEGEIHDFVLSKWYLDYEVKSDTHRKHLNLLLDTGVGQKNGYGFGFLNPMDEEPRSRTGGN